MVKNQKADHKIDEGRNQSEYPNLLMNSKEVAHSDKIIKRKRKKEEAKPHRQKVLKFSRGQGIGQTIITISWVPRHTANKR